MQHFADFRWYLRVAGLWVPGSEAARISTKSHGRLRTGPHCPYRHSGQTAQHVADCNPLLGSGTFREGFKMDGVTPAEVERKYLTCHYEFLLPRPYFYDG